MAQPSVASFFTTRKRSVIEDTKINRARKLQEKEEKSVKSKKKLHTVTPAIQTETKKVLHPAKGRKVKELTNNKNIQEFLNNIKNTTKETPVEQNVTEEKTAKTTSGNENAMDKVSDKSKGPSIKEIQKKMSRSAKLAELKASISRFQEKDTKLKEIEKKTVIIPQSPKIKAFKTIEVEVHTSPQKLFSPEKAYLSPKKDASGARRNLLNLLSPAKKTLTIPASPKKSTLDLTPKAALTLPFKYRYVAEMFRCIDTVSQILYNRKETITFRKLKPAVEEMLKRNLIEKHIAQIKTIYSEAFKLTQEKVKVFGTGMKHEQWELVFHPNIGSHEHITSDVLLERRRILFNKLLDKVKDYHSEFLLSLTPPLNIAKDKITKWHPEFDIEKVPDIELSEVPKPPIEEAFSSGKDVLEKAKEMFNCNTRMEMALERLRAAKNNETIVVPEQPKLENQSVLKGIPKALLEKVRQKQAAKALLTMTRSADKEKEIKMYGRLSELARITRTLYVSEKKGVLPLDVVVEKLGNCYRETLTKTEMEEHLKAISKEVPGWLVFHNMRNTNYVKLSKDADLSLVIKKLDDLAKLKNET
ncbi:unnamed protein product [Brassicogethes aeneus]|uniref:CDT1 Geminin-binding domain-containing protein n=1 Tax=Brassicogethes aeneus TaxID=1431903 RepID=A0A9P0ANL1_BRAAE|nr:unnamed protein product [Brassicogethes aeneus]